MNDIPTEVARSDTDMKGGNSQRRSRTLSENTGGSLKDIPVQELGALVLKEALSRAGLKPEAVDV